MSYCRFIFSYLTIFIYLKGAAAASPLEISMERLRSLAQQQKVNLLAFDRTLNYLKHNSDSIENKNYVTIIDYSKPSTEKRLFIFDLRNLKLFSLLVAHGRGSGLQESNSFSNKINSFKSSLGFIKTGLPYQSPAVGPALQLYGLEPQNNQTLQRGIVLHGAWYVGANHIKRYGRLGRSLGCPAVEKDLTTWVIDKLKGGSLIYSFHL